MPSVENRLPKEIWRVVAVGGNRRYWEAGSRNYSTEAMARGQADFIYRRRGATEIHIFRADLNWVEVKT